MYPRNEFAAQIVEPITPVTKCVFEKRPDACAMMETSVSKDAPNPRASRVAFLVSVDMKEVAALVKTEEPSSMQPNARAICTETPLSFKETWCLRIHCGKARNASPLTYAPRLSTCRNLLWPVVGFFSRGQVQKGVGKIRKGPYNAAHKSELYMTKIPLWIVHLGVDHSHQQCYVSQHARSDMTLFCLFVVRCIHCTRIQTCGDEQRSQCTRHLQRDDVELYVRLKRQHGLWNKEKYQPSQDGAAEVGQQPSVSPLQRSSRAESSQHD
mmetsp:Transcript_11415/g.34918  ORF Transcript_11415/g.34918 Transcript_11415/m.34918 type:complete len:268 (+) Transcript_11415:363-1166(+)